MTPEAAQDAADLAANYATRAAREARHSTRVTADRIAEHLEKYADQLTPNEVVACSVAVRAFADIAEGRRA